MNAQLQPSSRREVGQLGIIVLLALAVRTFLFIGYQGFDDRTYVAYAWMFANGGGILEARLADPWIARVGAWLPMALSIKAFGGDEWALCLYSLLTSLAGFPVLFVLGRHLFGSKTAFYAMLLLAFLPLDVFYATRAFADEAVGFWCLAGFTAFILAIDRGGARRALLAGLTVGMAYLAKETAVLLAVPFVLVLLQRRVWPCRSLLWMLAGFVAVLCLEWAFWTWATNDPLYRWKATLGSRADFAPQSKTIHSVWDLIPGPPPHEIFRSGNSLLEALLMFTTNEEWGFLFYFAFPLALFALARGGRGQKTCAVFILSIALLLLFFPLHFPFHTLNRDPRYYTMLSAPALLLFVDWARGLEVRWRSAALVVLVLPWIPCLYVGVISSDITVQKEFARFVRDEARERVWMSAIDASNVVVLSGFAPRLDIGIIRVGDRRVLDEPAKGLASPLRAMRPQLTLARGPGDLPGGLIALSGNILPNAGWPLERTVAPPPDALAAHARAALSALGVPQKYVDKVNVSQSETIRVYRVPAN